MKFGVLISAMLMLFATAGMAQPGRPMLPPNIGHESANIRSSITTTKTDVKITRATREQIQALRLALKAKLAAMHH